MCNIPHRKSEKKEQAAKDEDDAGDDDVKEETPDDEDASQPDEDNDVSEELDIREMRHKIVNLGWFTYKLIISPLKDHACNV